MDLPTEAEPVKVIEGDCLQVLRELPDGCVRPATPLEKAFSWI